jgi:UDP:flavonoid glycosyltransferase YjiC (YdhE family)
VIEPRREPRLRTIVFYISGHGFGHASRVIEVINALLAQRPALHVIVKTTAAKWLFDLTVKIPHAGRFDYELVECDTGIVQIDSLRLDEHASVQRALAFMSTFDARVDREAASLRQIGAALVVADMPALGIAAGARAGVPAAALGNFTWDWAYSAYPGSQPLVDAIGAAYSQADVALRLPMWGGFGAFTRVIDLPFVARHSMRDPRETRQALGLPTDKRLVLPSFGGHGLEGLQRAVNALDGYHVLFEFDEQKLYADGFRYEDLVRAADVVITKPGYGIIAECLANDTALLYTDRGNFIEYDVLVANMPRFLRTRFISHDDLFAGRWQEHLDTLLEQPPPPLTPATNGAEVAAQLLLEMISRISRA